MTSIGDRSGLDLLANAVEANSDRILRTWLSEAREIVAEGNWRPYHLTLARLELEARHIIQCLPRRLRSDPFSPQTPAERAGLGILAGEVPEDAARDTCMVTGFRLYYMLANDLWQASHRALPTTLTAHEGERLRLALLEALRKLMGLSPWAFVARIEERLRQQQEQIGAVYKRLLMAQEEERRRIARDVHDVLSQALAAAAFRTETAVRVMEKDPAQATLELDEIAQLIQYALRHVRDIIFDLRPTALDRFGLRVALEDYATRVQPDDGCRMVVRGTGDSRRLTEEQQVALFRIAQEAIWNALRHSGAQTTEVILDVADGEARLAVCDDGSGFDAAYYFASALDPEHYGLLCMRERAELAGGTLAIDSAPGQGTQVTVSVPLRSYDHEER
jgi:signal transduction histidine kinase